MSDKLELILELAARARDLESGPGWKIDVMAASEKHGEACTALWEELYRQLDARANEGSPVRPHQPPIDLRVELRKQMVAHLKSAIPDLVEQAIADF